ncbi:ATP-binding protein [Desulfosporosinus sp. OT]|uniref:ATP-binding protein n=1 Tax=Desulfosporosinus sp. OT TaxID=913865 RepID=UPI000223ACCA|nr:ATP-binding protein [Desulfosporosinus sp. OT]EGW36894.1 his Kinase A domain protein [Desulfosporosinus sp. OT]
MRDEDKSREQLINELIALRQSSDQTQKIEHNLNKTNTLLKLFNQKTNRKEYLDAVIMLLKRWIDCRCTGIRVLHEDGFIPYESFVGYSQEFLESENWLLVENNQCACIRVILEKPEPQDAICITNGGSFCCNNTIKFVCEMSAKEQSRFRGKCLEVGFKSVAIIPIRYLDRVLGVIHLADEREGKFPIEFVEFIEKVAPLIGEAMYRFNLEDELKHKNDNLEKLVEERAKELKDANEKLKRDITEQKRLEEELKIEKQRLNYLMDSLPGDVILISPDYIIKYVNANAQLKYGDPNNRTCYEYAFGRKERCVKCDINRVFINQENCYWEITKPDDQIFAVYASPFCDIDGSPMAIKISYNITSVKKTETEIKRLSKLNLIGEMAAGIAHEIRNPMTTVKGFLQFLGRKEHYNQDKEYFNLMIEELNRANSIITEFLSLAKNKLVELKMLDLNFIIKALSPLIHSDALLKDKYINLELENIPKLLLDDKEIRQLILNIVRNGIEAMTNGEYLTIKTYIDGHDVVFSVQDRGRGIHANIIDKIGTPFFSTKDNGTGLGLATCYSIANRHNAAIDFDTGSEGTTFYVRFKVSV